MSLGEYLRETVLAMKQISSETLPAFDVLHKVLKVFGKVSPPKICRTLSSLQRQRVIHKLGSLKAYIFCNQNCIHLAPIISIFGPVGGFLPRKTAEIYYEN